MYILWSICSWHFKMINLQRIINFLPLTPEVIDHKDSLAVVKRFAKPPGASFHRHGSPLQTSLLVMQSVVAWQLHRCHGHHAMSSHAMPSISPVIPSFRRCLIYLSMFPNDMVTAPQGRGTQLPPSLQVLPCLLSPLQI